MNLTLTIPDSSIPACQSRVDLYNTGSLQAPVTIEQLEQILLDERTAQNVAQFIDEKRRAMTPIADALIAAPDSVSNDVLAYAAKKLGL